jgi:DNA-binding cell septation regulator SpoVG
VGKEKQNLKVIMTVKGKDAMDYKKQSKAQLDGEFNAVAKPFSEQVRAAAVRAREMIYNILPEVTEVIWAKQKIIGYGTGPKKMSQHFCYIALNKAHINLQRLYKTTI